MGMPMGQQPGRIVSRLCSAELEVDPIYDGTWVQGESDWRCAVVSMVLQWWVEVQEAARRDVGTVGWRAHIVLTAYADHSGGQRRRGAGAGSWVQRARMAR